jgi:alkaline phosphatase D
MKVKPLSVGPIVGHTTHESTRIFGRGELEVSFGRPRFSHGVLQYKKKGSRAYKRPIYFKLNPNFDLTGVAVIQGLEADTVYQYQVGSIFSEVDSDKINVNSLLDWKDIEPVEFRTGSNDDTKPRAIVTGSCRYALRMLGGTWFDDRGDKTFGSVNRQVAEGRDADMLLMCGDQIYADDLNFAGADDQIDEFFKRYQKVFTTRERRKLMSSTPTYMILDDHEIEDNWPESANDRDWVRKFPAAIHAYSTYQASHSPLFAVKEDGGLVGTPTHLWYTFTDGCCDFFFCDTRTERNLTGPREMIGPRQIAALLDWLTDDSGRVKIVVTSVPLYEYEAEDKWHGFVDQRDSILEAIRASGVRRVMIIAGDVHASMGSALTLEGDANFKIVSVISSAFFWPYPHPRRRAFLLEGAIRTNDSTRRYIVTEATEVYPNDSFMRLDVDLDGVAVEFFSRKGALLGRQQYAF